MAGSRTKAAQALAHMGVSRFTLSPEDGLENVRSLLGEFGARAVLIVYQDTPLFLAESCAYANLIGGCPGKAKRGGGWWQGNSQNQASPVPFIRCCYSCSLTIVIDVRKLTPQPNLENSATALYF